MSGGVYCSNVVANGVVLAIVVIMNIVFWSLKLLLRDE